MPKTNIDYSNTVIYKIVCKDLNIKDVYIGHTTNFTKRKHSHKDRCCNEQKSGKHNYKVYVIIRENGGWDNWDMIEIEKYPCDDENEARSRERYWYELNHCTMNDVSPQRTKEEYREDNIEYIKQRDRNYYYKHKEEKQIYGKERYIQNKEKALLYRKEYYEKNKEQISEKYKTNKKTCECGSCVRAHDYKKHLKTKKHLEYEASL